MIGKFFFRTSFLLMTCISFFISAYFFNQIKNSELEFFFNEAEESANLLETTLEKNLNYVKIFRKIGEGYLNHYKDISENRNLLNYDLLEKTEKNTYDMDQAIVKNLHKDIGNITGIGNFEQDEKLMREIEMALNFNDVFKEVWESSNDSTWIYYTSKRSFINLYPWVSSEEFSFKNEILNKEFYMKGLPENNPEHKEFWTEPYLDEAGQGIMITASAPIYAGNEFKGTVSLDLTAKTLSYLLLKNIEYQTASILVDEKSQVLAFHKFEENMEKNIMYADELLPEELKFKEIAELKSFGKVVKKNKYFLVKIKIENVPWDLYTYKKTSIIDIKAFLAVSPMFIITLALLLVYYEFNQKKEAERQLRKMIKRLKLTTNQLEAASKTDPLTELLNRRGIIEEILKEKIRYKKTQKNFSIIICDIDHFKRINDTYGHDCGDYVLKNIAQLMTMNLKEQDFIGRWGGEEFVIMLIETDYSEALKVGERIRKRIEESIIEYNTLKINITMTFGVTSFNHDKNLEENIAVADIALYEGKNNGRNRVIGSKD